MGLCIYTRRTNSEGYIMPDMSNIYTQALEELEEIIKEQQTAVYLDTEENHIRADRILCAILRARGHDDIVDAYTQILKYY